MGTGRHYDKEFKIQAVKLAKEVGVITAAVELGIPKSTLATWCKKGKTGDLDTGSGTRTLAETMNIARQLQEAKKHIKELEKENKELKEKAEFLEEANAFFAASRQKFAKKKD